MKINIIKTKYAEALKFLQEIEDITGFHLKQIRFKSKY